MVRNHDPSDLDPIDSDAQTELVANLRTEISRLYDLLARATARADRADDEIAAAAKRLASASSKELERRTHEMLASLLPVIDDLDRAIEATNTHVPSAEVVRGLDLVRRSLLSRLGQFGVRHAPSLGERFDPQRHEAMASIQVTDPEQVGRVVAVVREGYLVGDHTLRPAGVAVGKR